MTRREAIKAGRTTLVFPNNLKEGETSHPYQIRGLESGGTARVVEIKGINDGGIGYIDGVAFTVPLCTLELF